MKMSKTLIIVLALLLGWGGGPLAAQQSDTGMTTGECIALFNEADTNGDNVLSQQEIAAADFDTNTGVSRSEFVSECQGS
jgi:hypothetical protein